MTNTDFGLYIFFFNQYTITFKLSPTWSLCDKILKNIYIGIKRKIPRLIDKSPLSLLPIELEQ